MAYDFSNYYSADPWSNIETNERQWYDPLLRANYARQSVYSRFATFKVDLAGGARARTITFNDLIPPRPNIAPIAARKMEATRLYTDAFQRDVTVERYGNGMAIHRESEMFSYWQRNGQYGLIPIINGSLGQVVVDHIDLLARNEYFRHPYAAFGANSASGFGALSNSDKISTGMVDSVWLGMRDRVRPFAPMMQTFPTGDELICVTTAGVVHDLKTEVGTGAGGLNFIDVQKYTDEGRRVLISGELGMYRGVRYVDNPAAKLWNTGEIYHQTAIKAAVAPGDGAPDPRTTKVEGVRRVGQPSSKHYIEVTDASGFSPNDMITIHELRHDGTSLAAYGNKGVLNGVIYDDPMIQNIEVHSVDTGTTPHRVYLKEPYMMTKDNGKGLETDLGGSVFGYITRGRHVHTAMFINPVADPALVCGVAQSPVIYTPPAVDDYLSMYRVTYDMWMKYAQWEPRSYEIRFLVGANKGFGALYY